ncbi:MAG: hypothetical protein M4579_003657 [Chaenotheca gracillima]|nr:MAG: hypothetical protein M4579_003657 [Chaenotheca gracillima]
MIATGAQDYEVVVSPSLLSSVPGNMDLEGHSDVDPESSAPPLHAVFDTSAEQQRRGENVNWGDVASDETYMRERSIENQLPVLEPVQKGLLKRMRERQEGDLPNEGRRPGQHRKASGQLDEFIVDLERRLDTELSFPEFEDADVHVFIQVPLSGSKNVDFGGGASLNTKVIRVHSKKLLSAGSTYFADLLAPTKQYRMTRRQQYQPLPPGIKYVLDLSPPQEGDVAVELTTELSCSEGVRKWFYASERWGVSRKLVGGLDAVEPRKAVYPVQDSTETSANEQNEDPKENEVHQPAPFYRDDRICTGDCNESTSSNPARVLQPTNNPDQPPKVELQSVPLDYTMTRHCTAIERVLLAIEDQDPKINSAPKLWTFFVMAKFFDCVPAAVDHIISWIYATPNTRFIEVLPEVCSRIAVGLQNYTLCRDAFSVLVGEEALMVVSRGHGRDVGEGFAILGRKQEDLDEEFQTRVEYASKTFADRINAMFSALVDPNMDWVTKLPEYQKLLVAKDRASSHAQDSKSSNAAADPLDRLCKLLRQNIRSHILHVLVGAYEVKSERFLNPTIPASSKYYNDLGTDGRILTKTFWKRLKQARFGEEQCRGLKGVSTKHAQDFLTSQGAQLVHIAPLTSALQECKQSFEQRYPNTGGVSSTAKSPKISKSGLEALKQAQKSSFHEGKDQSGSWNDNVTHSPLVETEQHETAASSNVNASPRPLANFPESHISAQTSWTGKTSAPSPSSVLLEIPQAIMSALPPEANSSSLDASLEDGLTRSLGTPALPSTSEYYVHVFSILDFMSEAAKSVHMICERVLGNSVAFDPGVTDSLLCLEDGEFQFLPLWAGGNDDGSGGVFGPSIPNAVAGPTEPGPHYHTGSGLSSAGTSDFSIVDDGATSSFDTSLAVEDGRSDHIDRRKVYSVTTASETTAAPSVASTQDVAFSDEGGEWAEVLKQKREELFKSFKDRTLDKGKGKAKESDEEPHFASGNGFKVYDDDDFQIETSSLPDDEDEGEDMEWESDSNDKQEFDFAENMSESTLGARSNDHEGFEDDKATKADQDMKGMK